MSNETSFTSEKLSDSSWALKIGEKTDEINIETRIICDIFDELLQHIMFRPFGPTVSEQCSIEVKGS